MDSSDPKCSICSENVETFCLDCSSPFYCKNCTEAHIQLASGKNHRTINLLSGELRNIKDTSELHCQGCKNRNIMSSAAYLCPVCRELQCQTCYQIHSNFKFLKPHQVIELALDGHSTTTKAPSKMADKKQKQSIDDCQFASDFEGALHITGATNIDFTVSQAPLSVTEENVFGASNATTMTYVGDFDVEVNSDRDVCHITDIACLPDGRVVVCDHYNEVKVYNTDCKYLYSVKYSGRAFGITVVSSNTVVILENHATLRYLQVDIHRGIKLDRYINIPPDAYAVSYAVHKFALLYPLSDRRKVVMINDCGVKLSVVKLTKVKGNTPESILLDSGGTRFYICDYSNHCVLCYRCQLVHKGLLWECSVPPNPHSVVHAGDSLFIVCKKTVYKIKKSGRYLQEVVIHGKNFDIFRPVAAFQTSCRKLLVASWGIGNNKVQTFQM